MSEVAWARRRFRWGVRLNGWRARIGTAVAGLKRVPRWAVGVFMLMVGSVAGTAGPFLVEQYTYERAQREAKQKLLAELLEQCAATTGAVTRYAQVLETEGAYLTKRQLRELSIREDAQVGMITASELERELERFAKEAEITASQFAEAEKKHNDQIDELEAWCLRARPQFRHSFPSRGDAVDAAFNRAAAGLAAYRMMASNRALAHTIVGSLHADKIRSAFLEKRAGKISDQEYREGIAESEKIRIGQNTARLNLDLSHLSALAASAEATLRSN
jgi:hypothetical protein